MPVRLLRSGTVRDLYRDDDGLILVTNDRIAVDGMTLSTPIPGKGALVNALSVWWFKRLSHVLPNHFVDGPPVPEAFSGRGHRCQELAMIPFEFVVRGYLAGAGFKEYRSTGTVSQVAMPRNLRLGSQLPEPIICFSRKGRPGFADTPVAREYVESQLGQSNVKRICSMCHEAYALGAAHLRARGLILADTKLELGWSGDGSLLIGDECMTSDSSRIWLESEWCPGAPLPSLDRQIVRDWLSTCQRSWDNQVPAIPASTVQQVISRYTHAFMIITNDGVRPSRSRSVRDAGVWGL